MCVAIAIGFVVVVAVMRDWSVWAESAPVLKFSPPESLGIIIAIPEFFCEFMSVNKISANARAHARARPRRRTTPEYQIQINSVHKIVVVRPVPAASALEAGSYAVLSTLNEKLRSACKNTRSTAKPYFITHWRKHNTQN